MLVEAAVSSVRTRTYLGAQFRQVAKRRRSKRASFAVAHSILVSAYYMLQRGEPYRDLGPDYLSKAVNPQAQTRRLVAQLGRLGHTVVLDTCFLTSPLPDHRGNRGPRRTGPGCAPTLPRPGHRHSRISKEVGRGGRAGTPHA